MPDPRSLDAADPAAAPAMRFEVVTMPDGERSIVVHRVTQEDWDRAVEPFTAPCQPSSASPSACRSRSEIPPCTARTDLPEWAR